MTGTSGARGRRARLGLLATALLPLAAGCGIDDRNVQLRETADGSSHVSDSGRSGSAGSGGDSGSRGGAGGSVAPGTGGLDAGSSGAAGGGAGGGGTGGGGAGGAAPVGGSCEGACCPTERTCYSDPARSTSAPGAECLATRDNTSQDHIQIRQTWVRHTRPPGVAIDLINQVLAGLTQLPWPACNMGGGLGAGGYIQLVDLFLRGGDANLGNHFSTTGFATSVDGAALPTILADGLCYATEAFVGEPAYRLGPGDMSLSSNYPLGLPRPMPLLGTSGWPVGPTRAKRIPQDFNVSTDRLSLLAALAPTGVHGAQGFRGVFYFDSATGDVHGFSAIDYVLTTSGGAHTAVPIREVETRARFNDPASRNCIGRYRADALSPQGNCASTDLANPTWGGGDCTASTGNTACALGQGPASTKGYYLITELEQVFNPLLQATLCVAYQTQSAAQANGFYDSVQRGCRTARWNPADPANGLPLGDWCAATNSAATQDCHDAWRGEWFNTFSGATIKMDVSEPATCPGP